MASKKDESEGQNAESTRQLVIKRWLEFESELAEDSDGSEELYEMLFNSPAKKCSNCHGVNVVRIQTTRHIRCQDCSAKSSLTANTFFNNARRPKAWLGAIRLMEHGLEFSTRMLSLLAKVAYATAWDIMKKLDELLKRKADSQMQIVPSKSFERVFMKRSRETPAREHPKSEQRVAEKEQRRREKMLPKGLTELEEKILTVIGERAVDAEYIAEKVNLPFSAIAAQLIVLEVAGFIERISDDIFRRKLLANSIAKPTADLRRSIKRFVKLIGYTKRGISRKYLHLYLARYWCVVDRERWSNGALLKECLQALEISEFAVKKENAPLLVPFPVLAA